MLHELGFRSGYVHGLHGGGDSDRDPRDVGEERVGVFEVGGGESGEGDRGEWDRGEEEEEEVVREWIGGVLDGGK